MKNNNDDEKVEVENVPEKSCWQRKRCNDDKERDKTINYI